MKVKIRLSDIATRPDDLAEIDPKAPWFNSLEDNWVGDKRYNWNYLLKSIKEHGYDPHRFNNWIKVVPFYDDTKIKKFLLQDGNHRVAICKHLYGDDFKVEALIALKTCGTLRSYLYDVDERGMEDE
jgi:hypothetical protein